MAREIDVRTAIREAMDEEMERDERVFIIGEEVAEYNGAYKVTKGMLDKWGDKRVIDTPISENGFTGLGIGAAMTGLRPIVELMSFNFSFVAADQIISNAAKIHYMSGGRFNVPVVFRGPNGAAAQVSSQHSHCVESIYGNLPGLIIIAPHAPADYKGLLKAAIRNDNPVLFLECELAYGKKGEVPDGEYLVPIGKAKVAAKGSDVTLVSYSHMVDKCREAAKEMAGLGVSVELIDLRTVRPLDLPTILASIKKTNRCVIVEEGHYFGGTAAEVGFEIMEKGFDYLDAPIKRVSQRDTPMPYSEVLEAETVPNPKRIVAALKSVMKGE